MFMSEGNWFSFLVHRLTLLLQTGHHLDVGQVLQLVSQCDGVVLALGSTEVTVQGGLRTEEGAAEAAA